MRVKRGTFNLIRIALTVALGGFPDRLRCDRHFPGAVPFIRDYFDLSRLGGKPQAGLGRELPGLGRDGRERGGRHFERPLWAQKRAADDGSAIPRIVLDGGIIHQLSDVRCGPESVGVSQSVRPFSRPPCTSRDAEIAPAHSRGSLVSLNQLMIVIGISVSFFSNYFLLSLGANSWRWMLGCPVGTLQPFIFALLTLVPEEPPMSS